MTPKMQEAERRTMLGADPGVSRMDPELDARISPMLRVDPGVSART